LRFFIFTELNKIYKRDQIYFYRTVSKAEIDFVIEEKYNSYILIEVKYKNKVSLPIIMKNFDENYPVNKKIIITKDLLLFKENIYYIPATLLSFINI